VGPSPLKKLVFVNGFQPRLVPFLGSRNPRFDVHPSCPLFPLLRRGVLAEQFCSRFIVCIPCQYPLGRNWLIFPDSPPSLYSEACSIFLRSLGLAHHSCWPPHACLLAWVAGKSSRGVDFFPLFGPSSSAAALHGFGFCAPSLHVPRRYHSTFPLFFHSGMGASLKASSSYPLFLL